MPSVSESHMNWPPQRRVIRKISSKEELSKEETFDIFYNENNKNKNESRNSGLGRE